MNSRSKADGGNEAVRSTTSEARVPDVAAGGVGGQVSRREEFRGSVFGTWVVAHSEGVALVARTVSVCVLLLLFVVPLGILAWLTLSSVYFAQHSDLLVSFGGSVAKNPLSESEVLKLLLGFVTAAAALRGKGVANAPEILAAMAVWGLLTIALLLAFVEHYALFWGFVEGTADFSPELRSALLNFTESLRRDLLLLFGVLLGLRSVPANEAQ